MWCRGGVEDGAKVSDPHATLSPPMSGRGRWRRAPYRSCDLSGALLDAVRELGDLVVEGAAFGHVLADLAVGVHARGVVAAAERLADARQGEIRQLATEVHRDLTGIHQDAAAGMAAQIFQA